MTPVNSHAALILINGELRTQDEMRPVAQAAAIGFGRILAVGDNRDIEKWSGPDTKVLDLKGRLVLPGMMDSHFHYYDWSLGRRHLELADVKNFEELIERVDSAAKQSPPDSWILGQGWNESDWPEHRMPDRDSLDAVAPDHPVALWRCDLHLMAVNTKALEIAGIDENTPDPPEGVIVRNASGHPNGILRELATNLVKEVMPSPGEEEVVQAMADAIPVLHSLGLTGVHDNRLMGGMEGAAALRAWQKIRQAGRLNLRCWVGIPGECLEQAIDLGLRTGLGDARLRIGHVKFFADGGMGARTAWMIDPYLDAEYGMPLSDMAELENAVFRADRAGLAVIVHAIGDRANREVVTIFEKLAAAGVATGQNTEEMPAIPHRIDHVQMIRPEDLARLARLDLAACVQPHNMILDIGMIDTCVADKGRWTYAYRDMLDAGIRVLFSSDCPVCDPSPLVGIHAAVTRQRPEGTPEGGWYPSQRISVDEAVRGYTISPAKAYGTADELGSISEGKRADLIVLDRNIYTIAPMDILNAHVDVTIFDGRVVYERDPQ